LYCKLIAKVSSDMSDDALAIQYNTLMYQWWANPKSNLTCQIPHLQTQNLKSSGKSQSKIS